MFWKAMGFQEIACSYWGHEEVVILENKQRRNYEFIDFQTKYDITHKSMHIHHCCNILSLIRFLLFILVIVFLLLGYFWQNVCYGLAGVALIAFFDCCQGASSL